MADKNIHIRRAGLKDLPTLAKFGLALARLHATFDKQRFIVPEGGEMALRRYFEGELARADAVVLIAEIAATPVGYAFLRFEPASIEELRAAGAWLHDIYVVAGSQSRGVGRGLVEAAFVAARRLGSPSLRLGVSPHNASGRALFSRMGFRPTMIEMSAEIDNQDQVRGRHGGAR